MSRKASLKLWASDVLWLAQPIAGVSWLLVRRLLITLWKVVMAVALIVLIISSLLVSLVVIFIGKPYEPRTWLREKMSFDKW